MLKQNLIRSCFCFFLCFWVGNMATNGQNSLNNDKILKGKTIQQSTGEAISFVNIGVKGTTIGTASDSKGEFTLKIPANYIHNFVLFYSAIGYESGEIPLNSVAFDSIKVVKLFPTQYKLNELDVNAQSKIAFGIIKDAVAKIPTNYPSFPYSYAFLYKAEKTYNGKLEKVAAQGTLYDSLGYKPKDFFAAYASRSYTFEEPAEIEKNKFAFNKGITGMDDFLNFDIVGSTGNVLGVDQLEKFKLTLTGTTTYQQDSVYVISYKNLEPSVTSTGDYYVTSYEGEIYVSKTSKAILKNTTQVKSRQVALYGRGFAIPEGKFPMGTDVNYEFSTTYNLSNGYYQLGTISLKASYLNSSNSTVNFDSQLIIEGFKRATATTVPIRDLLKSGR